MLAVIDQIFIKVARDYFPNIEESPDTLWTQLTQKYPYSALIYLLLMRVRYFSKNISPPSSMLIDTQQANAMERLYLFFYENPLWIDYLLKKSKMDTIGISTRNPEISTSSLLHSPSSKEMPIHTPSSIHFAEDISYSTPISIIPNINTPVLIEGLPTPGSPPALQHTYKKRSIKEIKKEMIEEVLAKPRKRGRPPKNATTEMTPTSRKRGSKKVINPPLITREKVSPTKQTNKKHTLKEPNPIVTASSSQSMSTQSFNDWLKNARKVKGSIGIHFSKEKNEDLEDLYTPTMAHLYEQQGNPAKAIEIYQKLIQQYPSKKIAFSQKITQLKKKL